MSAKAPLVLTCLVLGACTVGKDYQPPKLSVAPEWQTLAPKGASQVSFTPQGAESPAKAITQMPFALTPDWWEQFHDPLLSQLLEKAKDNNHDVKVALGRIAEARGNARVADSALYPQLNASASISRTGALRSTATPPDTDRQAGVSGAWDIDIFGGDRRSIEAALAEVQATEADKDKVLLTLITDVASNYMQLRSLQQQRILTVRNLDAQRDTLNVTQEQRKQGAVSDFEVSRASGLVNTTDARLPQIDTAIVAALNRLSVLTGEAPTLADAELATPHAIPDVPASIVVATPLDTIRSRPDVIASERRLAETTALTSAALAQLYPKISLQMFFGSQFSQIYGYSTPVNVTANALMPLLDWGHIHGQIDAANARQQQAYENYQQTVLLALEQIENALTAYINEQARQITLQQAAEEQRKAAEVAEAQYKVGATTQLDLLTAENSRLDAETEMTLSKASLATDLIQLYTALGQTYEPASISLQATTAIGSPNTDNFWDIPVNWPKL